MSNLADSPPLHPAEIQTGCEPLDVNTILEQLDKYIVAMAQRNVPQQISAPETRDLDVDEIAQNARIKLWQALQKDQILNARAYVRSIVYHEAINMVRSNKPKLSLFGANDGELSGGKLLMYENEALRDPAYIVEQAEQLAERAAQAAQAIQTLPPRQQRAILCTLLDNLDNVLPLLAIFKAQKLDIAAEHWPEQKAEMQLLKASLSMSRKKLRRLLLANETENEVL